MFGFRFGVYALFSALMTYGVIQHAVLTREQFYPTVIFLVTNKLSIVVLCNMAAVAIVSLAMATKAIFLGELKPAEVLRVSETMRYTIPEVCIALTIFREELSMRVLTLFAMLLFSKFFHVLIDERMNELEGHGAAAYTRRAHIRLVALISSLAAMDALCLATFAYIVTTSGYSVVLMFAFEYSLLLLEVARVAYRYAIVLIAARMPPGAWGHERSLYLLYGKLGVDIVKLVVYACYFMLLLAHYGMPIIMVRDLVRVATEVNGELQNVLASRRLRSTVHKLPSPTAADLQRHDPTCSVCFVEVTADDAPAAGEGQAAGEDGAAGAAAPPAPAAGASHAKLLSCGHILHTECLLLWTQQQRKCPVCRADIEAMIRGVGARQQQGDQARARAAAAAAGAQAPAAAGAGQPAAAGAAADRDAGSSRAGARAADAGSARKSHKASASIGKKKRPSAEDAPAEKAGAAAATTSAKKRSKHRSRKGDASSDDDPTSSSSASSSSSSSSSSSDSDEEAEERRQRRKRRAAAAKAAATPDRSVAAALAAAPFSPPVGFGGIPNAFGSPVVVGYQQHPYIPGALLPVYAAPGATPALPPAAPYGLLQSPGGVMMPPAQPADAAASPAVEHGASYAALAGYLQQQQAALAQTAAALQAQVAALTAADAAAGGGAAPTTGAVQPASSAAADGGAASVATEEAR